MSSVQKKMLRIIFVSYIYCYSKFAQYLSTEWKSTSEEDNQLLKKEQTQEIGLKQLNEKSYADAIELENNISDKTKETISTSLTNEVSNKNSEIVKVTDNDEIKKKDEPSKFVKIDADKEMEITGDEVKKKEDGLSVEVEKELSDKNKEIANNDEIEKKEESSKESLGKTIKVTDNGEINMEEESCDDNLSDRKEVKNNKDDIRINASVTSQITSKEKFKNDRKKMTQTSYKQNSLKAKNLPAKGENSSIKAKNPSIKTENPSIQVENPSIKIEKLQLEAEMLRQEAAKYQAALGEIMNVGWRDDDSNNSMQLIKDIEKLQKDLADFTRAKRKVVIKDDTARTLLQGFKCETLVENKINAKLVVGAALQQKLIEHTIKNVLDYFNRTFDELPVKIECIANDKLEAAIISRTNDLINLTERFTKSNTGTDAHTQLLPIKIRQHIYAALGQHSFINSDHSFIKRLVKENLDGMNKYRTIEDEEKNKKINSDAATIIKQILHLLHFRLYTQEPKPTIKFYKSGEKFDHGVMELVGRIRKDNDNDKEKDNEELEVEICSFPLVALLENLNDEEKRRVFTKAQVIVRPKNSV